MTKAHPYRLTTLSCFVGIFIQAIASNIMPVLFVPFMRLYGLSFGQLGLLVGIFFTAQLLVDLLFSKAIDKYGFRIFVLCASLAAFVGLLMFALTPRLFDNIYTGIIIATIFFAGACGTLEIVLSPIIHSIPNENKGPAMTLMHSFYAWGQAATIIVTTLLLFVLGIGNWPIIMVMWSMVPIISFVMFLRSKYPPVVHEHHRMGFRALFRQSFFLIAMLAIFFGAATELTMSQWASSFTEKALHLPKVSGDLLGMCGFAIMMGLGRTLHGKWGHRINMHRILIIGSILATAAYVTAALSPWVVLSVAMCALCGLFASLMWPGTLVITAERFPLAGSFMFAMMAAAGDLGAGAGPWWMGQTTDWIMQSSTIQSMISLAPESLAMRGALLLAAVLPLGSLICHLYLQRKSTHKDTLPHEVGL